MYYVVHDGRSGEKELVKLFGCELYGWREDTPGSSATLTVTIMTVFNIEMV